MATTFTTLTTTQNYQLLLGCGHSREKKLYIKGKEEWTNLFTIDFNPDVKPDLVFDLNNPYLPFNDNSVDEIHAYEVFEHTGKQGDFRFFFEQFNQLYRILKPDGHIFATVPLPSSVWAWGDPSHTRVFPKETLVFLHQPSYDGVGVTPLSDFRFVYKSDFDVVHLVETEDTLQFGLKAIKPSRCKIT